MIISKTPLRMSFVGGGSDLSSFYSEEVGAVLSTAIDKYIYINVNKKFDNGIRIAYSETEEINSVAEIKHKLFNRTLDYLGISGGIEITTIADIPSKGTGLGSSSSFTVGLIHAVSRYQEKKFSRQQLADMACKIEIEICGEPIGKQDQYAAAFGGLNLIEFYPDQSVLIKPISASPETIKCLEKNILVFYTGITRDASVILASQNERTKSGIENRSTLRKMVKLVYDMKHALESNQLDLIGEILNENWGYKKSLTSGISSEKIDEWYSLGMKAGSTGGKLLGAGAGGFLMFYANQNLHSKIEEELFFLKKVIFKFDEFGSRLILGE